MFLRAMPVVVGILLSATAITGTAQAQSFDCRRARHVDEIAICQSPDLSQLDEKLATIYDRVDSGLGRHDRRRLRRNEDRWVVMRRRCGADHECIQQAYQARLQQFAIWYPAQSGVAPAPEPETAARKPPPSPRAASNPAPEPPPQTGSSTPPAPPAATKPAQPAKTAATPGSSAPTITWVDPAPAK